ncbi:MAG: efflux RND transporter periplasmic adaptor subunit [Desulfobacca sp.]|nr:efflux RND transporter periplasmic adaptor subunit [Desulfobacca sp.]
MEKEKKSLDLERLRIRRPDQDASLVLTPRRSRVKIGAVLLSALLLVLAVLYAVGVLSWATEVEVATVVKIYPAQAFTLLNASGYVVAQRKAAVSSKSTGRLAYLGVEEGSRIKKDEVIATLENQDLIAARDQFASNVKVAEAALLEAKAEMADAEVNYRRYRDLVAVDLVSRQDFDAAEARYKKAQAAVTSALANINAARAALAKAQTEVEYTLIRGPFDGLVLTKNAEVGEVVAPFGAATNARAAVVTMADMDSLMVEADVAESNIGQVRQGQPCEIQLDAIPGERFQGEVHMIVPTADRSKATVLTKVKFHDLDPRILPEMSSKVAFLSRALTTDEEEPRLAVTTKALMEQQGKTRVFLVQENRVQAVSVVTGDRLGDLTEIKSGLKEGDRVVISPPADLKEGDKVKIKEV